ncbi:hypothetical protein RHEC894_PC00167 (plasmid) [Rhizobium sp. CIAT894]|nr:hypothetical protein RHEC894_PC00167 [Rhizobium sp. CIAT894]
MAKFSTYNSRSVAASPANKQCAGDIVKFLSDNLSIPFCDFRRTHVETGVILRPHARNAVSIGIPTPG